MSRIYEVLKQHWDQREGAPVFTTVDARGVPNSVYVLAIKLLDDGGIAIADNKFVKTRANIKAGSTGSFLFMAPDHKAFQAKGKLEYYTSGPLFDDMLTWVPPKYGRHAVVILRPEKLYCGAEEIA